MDGYCRHFDATDEGNVELGIFKEGQPNGKFQSF